MNAIQRRLTAIRVIEKMEKLHEHGSSKVEKTENGYIYKNSKNETIVAVQTKKRS